MIALLRLRVGSPLDRLLGSHAWVCLGAGEQGIAASTLPQLTPGRALSQVDPSLAALAGGDGSLVCAVQALRRFFAGEKVDFDFALDLSRLPAFMRRVLLVVAGIPYGARRSYGWVARRAGRPRAARAVGQVMARNPLAPIVPCHRVVGADGSLVGFGPGLDYKRYLLEMEGAAAQSGEG